MGGTNLDRGNRIAKTQQDRPARRAAGCLVLAAPVFAAAAVFLPARSADGEVIEGHYVLAPSLTSGYTAVAAPSVNDLGDVVYRARKTLGQDVTALLYDPVTKAYTRQLVRTGEQFGPFPVINDARNVATIAYDSSFSFGVVQRHDFVAGSFLPTRIARSQPDGSAPNPSIPFQYLGPTVTVDETGFVAFRGTSDIFLLDGIWADNTEVLAPSAHPRVVDENQVAVIDDYVASGGVGRYGYRGRSSTSEPWTLYRSTPASPAPQPLAGPSNGFAQLGMKPGISERGTVAFADAGSVDIFLAREGAPGPVTATAFGVRPGSTRVNDFVSVNKFDQVAFLGTNRSGALTLFSTNLGATREIVAVGDRLDPADASTTVTGLTLYDGLMDSGQLVYLAQTSGGPRVVRTNRAYSQAVLLDSPAAVPWATDSYLLRGRAGYGAGTIRRFGCNLTSTANTLSFYGLDVTPRGLQQWLLAKYDDAATPALKGRYITPSNDFTEAAIEEYALEQFNAGNTDVGIQSMPYAPTGLGSNRATMIAELRGGNPVKLRVPSHTGANYQRFGHYVLAYGLTDGTKPGAQVTNDDILIHDPGNGGVYTLGEYERKFNYQATHPNWLDDATTDSGAPAQRLRLYRATAETGPVPRDVSVTVHSPVNVVLTDPLGRRLGLGGSGDLFGEIPGGLYWHDESYASLDDGSGAPEFAWATGAEEVKNLYVTDPLLGQYTLDAFGTGTGEFEILVDLGLGGGMERFTGNVTPGQHVVFTFQSVPEPAFAAYFGAGALLAVRCRTRRSGR